MLFVITAPSGAGKTTIVRELMKHFPELVFSVSATTRQMREYETNGKDYFFISHNEFEQRIKQNEFVEYEIIHGEYYGTLKSEIDRCIDKGYDMIFDLDVKGALTIKKVFPEAITFFIYVPENVIIGRLKNRKTESHEQLKKRIERIRFELSFKERFDCIIENSEGSNGLEKAVNEIITIIKKYKKKEK